MTPKIDITAIKTNPYRFSVAPMLDWTDRHARFFHRLMTRSALLYTEMVTTGALIHGDAHRHLAYNAEEHPVALQLGGSDPADLATCARMAADYGYDEINLNVGCPSDRVQNGRFGACLMAEPQLVADCVAAMKAAVRLPVTVKCRIGIDDQDEETALDTLADALVAVGVDHLIVHARKAWLQGLSPKENRDIPPLNYDRVYRLKQRLPALPISLNGGVLSVEAARDHLAQVDGVMMGRAAYQEPFRLLSVDTLIFGEASAPLASRDEAVEAMIPYIARHVAAGGKITHVTKHMLGLYHNVPGARLYRRHLATAAYERPQDVSVVSEALGLIRSAREQAESRERALAVAAGA